MTKKKLDESASILYHHYWLGRNNPANYRAALEKVASGEMTEQEAVVQFLKTQPSTPFRARLKEDIEDIEGGTEAGLTDTDPEPAQDVPTPTVEDPLFQVMRLLYERRVQLFKDDQMTDQVYKAFENALEAVESFLTAIQDGGKHGEE